MAWLQNHGPGVLVAKDPVSQEWGHMSRIPAPGTGRSEFKGSCLNSKFEASLLYMKPCLKYCSIKAWGFFSIWAPGSPSGHGRHLSICLLVWDMSTPSIRQTSLPCCVHFSGGLNECNSLTLASTPEGSYYICQSHEIHQVGDCFDPVGISTSWWASVRSLALSPGFRLTTIYRLP